MKITICKKKTYINVSIKSNSKQVICDLLCKAIQATTAGDDLKALRYDPKEEVVHADFVEAYDARQIPYTVDRKQERVRSSLAEVPQSPRFPVRDGRWCIRKEYQSSGYRVSEE